MNTHKKKKKLQWYINESKFCQICSVTITVSFLLYDNWIRSLYFKDKIRVQTISHSFLSIKLPHFPLAFLYSKTFQRPNLRQQYSWQRQLCSKPIQGQTSNLRNSRMTLSGRFKVTMRSIWPVQKMNWCSVKWFLKKGFSLRDLTPKTNQPSSLRLLCSKFNVAHAIWVKIFSTVFLCFYRDRSYVVIKGR